MTLQWTYKKIAKGLSLEDREADHHEALLQNLDDETSLAHFRRFTTDFASDPTEIDPDTRKFLFDRGFLPEKAALYAFNKFDYKLYLNDVQRWMTRGINKEYANVFNNKILFTQVFRNFTAIAPINAIWREGRIIQYDNTWDSIKAGQCPIGSRYVIKPLGGGGGGSVFFIQVNRNSVVIESNEEGREREICPLAEIDRIFEGAKVPFMVTEFIQQGHFTQSLYPLTVNTVRMLIIRNQKTGLPHVVRAVQRIGTSSSYPIDNFSMGGLSVDIDVDTGIMGNAVAAAGPHMGKFWTYHPDTGEKLKGLKIPRWSAVVEEMRDLFLKMPYIHYCGFDLILRDEDLVVLEGNSFSQVRLFQMHRPLFLDEVYKNFLESQGIYNGI